LSDLPAILHVRGGPPVGEPCRVAFLGDTLRVESTRIREVPVADIEVSVGGFDDDAITLSWREQGEPCGVTVRDRAALAALTASAPPSIAKRIRGGHGDVRWHRGKWNLVIGTLATLVLAVIVAWWQSERIVAWIADQVSVETEVRIGSNFLRQVQIEQKLHEHGAAADTLKALGAKLTAGSRYRYRWFVSENKEVNALAIPGGFVIVNAGLIKELGSGDELAAVLAHEVQHIERRHSLRQMIHAAGWAAVLAVVLGDVSAITAVVLHQLGNLSNSRELEHEADVEGMKALQRAGITLDGMPQVMRRLLEVARKEGYREIPLLSSHPATKERVAELTKLAKEMPCECKSVELDWPALQVAAKTLGDAPRAPGESDATDMPVESTEPATTPAA
jgi:beta-barrel assembly-enhancing protease